MPTDPKHAAAWVELGALWERACAPRLPELAGEPFPLDEHELALHAMSLSVPQCHALLRDARGDDGTDSEAMAVEADPLASLCDAVGR